MIPMTEDQWQSRITDYCDLRGLRWHHEVDSRRSKSGFPDLVIVGPYGLLFAELKKEDGKVSPEQSDWLGDLRHAGVLAFVWKPSNWDRVVLELDILAGAKRRGFGL